MIEFINKYKQAFTVGATLSVLTICYFQQRDLTKLRTEVDTQTQIIDSLRDDAFNNSTIVGRYELTLDHLKETNPKAAADFENFLNHETE
jgi:hypothetical protein